MSTYLNETDAGRRIMQRCDELGSITEPGAGVTRLYLSPQHRMAAETIAGWMRDAGMDARIDEAGNVVGRYHSDSGGGPYLLTGSHMDSVVHAGCYDGPLGVLTSLDCVAVLHGRGRRLPFGVEVVAFADEEGTRFRTTLAGSRAITGQFGEDLFNAKDGDGLSVREAMMEFGLDPDAVGKASHRPDELIGYVELHIEQGPVLQAADLPIGVVTAISGQTRAVIKLKGAANHAGTVPMGMRKDPLLAAAEIALAVERVASAYPDTVGTVGFIKAEPGSINVIPGEVSLTVDLRSQADDNRHSAFRELDIAARAIAALRGVGIDINTILDLKSCPCAPGFVSQMTASVESTGVRPLHLPSGAGHDGMAMSAMTDIGMIFVRCKDGISHSPEESVTAADVATGASALLHFIENFQGRP
ncbi:allantoate amidohydrolase [Aminobacter sp. AP02]|uniref:allantoate amidohydrolase n=1 Tax=Aminobacter sp. AP02 TaxID=2135737 RepID=UPI000D6B2EE8|nr:allantoate amidohydrolase [Aminobacter sp. AP02]PWK66470.1 allantoate deiminase [Aminobacter sp. AP02]